MVNKTIKTTLVLGNDDLYRLFKTILPTLRKPVYAYKQTRSTDVRYDDLGIPTEDLHYESDCLKKSHESEHGTIILDRCFQDDVFLKHHLREFTGDIIICQSAVPMIPGYMRCLIHEVYCLSGMRDCDRKTFATKNFVEPSDILTKWNHTLQKGSILRVEGKCLRPS